VYSSDFRAFLDAMPTGWLLEGEAFVRYRTFIDLLKRPEDDSEALKARGNISKNPLVRRIFDRRNPDGYWGTPKDIHNWWPKKDTTFWVLGTLADFGFTHDDPRVARACEYVFGEQFESGAFGWGPPSTPGDCFTGILCESLAKLGYGSDPRLERAYRWLMDRQRLDGGFWCKNMGLPGRPREREPSCAFGTLCVLGALAQNSELRESEVAKRALKFLLRCWENRGKVKYAGHDSQIGRGWEKLKYPFTDYRILKYLDILSRFESARKDRRMIPMMGLLISKQDERGRFTPESIHKCWSGFDFGQKKEPSRWITMIVYRIMRRMDS
jgi:hypothetical protein